MGKIYKVPVKIIFEGEIIIKADSKIQARKNVKEKFKLRSSIHSYPYPGNEDLIDWNVPIQNTDIETGIITIKE